MIHLFIYILFVFSYDQIYNIKIQVQYSSETLANTVTCYYTWK